MRKQGIVVLMFAAILTAGSSLALTGCEEKEGPAERLGEEIDEAVDEAKDAVDKD